MALRPSSKSLPTELFILLRRRLRRRFRLGGGGGGSVLVATLRLRLRLGINRQNTSLRGAYHCEAVGLGCRLRRRLRCNLRPR